MIDFLRAEFNFWFFLFIAIVWIISAILEKKKKAQRRAMLMRQAEEEEKRRAQLKESKPEGDSPHREEEKEEPEELQVATDQAQQQSYRPTPMGPDMEVRAHDLLRSLNLDPGLDSDYVEQLEQRNAELEAALAKTQTRLDKMRTVLNQIKKFETERAQQVKLARDVKIKKVIPADTLVPRTGPQALRAVVHSEILNKPLALREEPEAWT